MEVTVLNTQERPLLKRKEVTARIFFEGVTPSRQDVAKTLSEKLGCKRDLIIVRQIKTAFGDTSATVLCHCYSDAKTLQDIESEEMRTKNAKKEEPKPEPAEEAAPESAEEAPEAAEEQE